MNMKKIVNILGLISFFALIICVMTVSASASEAAQSEEDWDVVTIQQVSGEGGLWCEHL